MDELESGFRFNDAILRSMTLLKKEAVTEQSPIALATAEENKTVETKVREEKPVEDDISKEKVKVLDGESESSPVEKAEKTEENKQDSE